MATTSRSDQSKAKIGNEVEIDPKYVDKLKKSSLGAEQAPTTAAQTPGTTAWQNLRDVLGPPFDSERVTLSQMRQLRKDPMIAFGLHYRKVPIARAEWYIEARDKKGSNRQVAAFIDACIRRIYARYIFQRTLALDFGYQAIAKRFVLANPGGVYEDATDLDENGNPSVKPIWDEGSILPVIYKASVALRPELVEPVFDDKTEEFLGVNYTLPSTSAAAAKKQSGRKKATGIMQIDVFHALWATNQRDAEHGSIFGYPLTGYARDYWWAYKFLFGLSNRGYERLAIPPVLAFHPEGSTIVDAETGERRPNWEIALEMAERLRSNAVGAVPSTMAEGAPGETSNTQRAWDFKFLETPTDALSVFDSRFNYLNVMKLRSVWVPELAFTGGEVGRTGGNVAEQMAEVFNQSQQLLMEEIVEEINSYVIPQLLLLNFAEFVNGGGSARMISRGFRAEDMDLYKQLIQLFGQADPEMLARLDIVEVLRRIGLPLKDADAYAAEREYLATQQAAEVTQVPNVPGTTIANPNVNPGQTAGGSVPEPNAAGAVTGTSSAAGFATSAQPFIYIQGNEPINLEFADVDDFLAGLPTSKHYQDKTIRALTVQMRRLWLGHWRRLYPQFARYIKGLKTIEFEDEEDSGIMYQFSDTGMYLAGERMGINKRNATKAARKIAKDFQIDSDVLAQLSERSGTIIRKILKREAYLEAKRVKMTAEIDDATFDTFVNNQVARLIKFTHQTFTDEVRDHLINEIREGRTPGEIADGLVSRFDSMPISKSDRIARSETRDAVNAGTLISSEGAGVKYVKAIDGEEFDQECRDRNGKLLTVKEAWREMRKEHPYGQLGFDPVPRADFSISWVDEMPEEREDHFAYFDDASSTAVLLRSIDDETANRYLANLFDRLSTNGHKVPA